MKNLFHYRSLIEVAVIIVVMAFMASQMTEVSAEKKPKAPVEKTGQTVIYEVGDDGDLQRGVKWPKLRFKDNGDGTIKDELTKLIWDKDANRFGPRTWSQALTDCNQLADNSGDLTDGSVAGDWHLANVKEYVSLFH